MKFSLKKAAAFLAALSIMTSVGASSVSATTSMVVDVENILMIDGEIIENANLALATNGKVQEKKNRLYRENKCNEVLQSVVNYFSNLGFVYSNPIKICVPGNYGPNKFTPKDFVSETVFITAASNVPEGDIQTGYGVIALGSMKLDKYSAFKNDFYNAKDVLAHEYVHLITQQKVGWNALFYGYSGKNGTKADQLERAAIGEAYCDILGELTESNPDWTMGHGLFSAYSSYCYRNLENPQATVTPARNFNHENVKYYTDYLEYKAAISRDSFQIDNGNGGKIKAYYTGSTVLSHAAYLMYKSGIPKNDLAAIWLKSLDYYGEKKSNPKFRDCRAAVYAAASSYLRKYSSSVQKTYLNYINSAFNSAHIYY